MAELTPKLKELRQYYEKDLLSFAKYLNPQYMYGEIHEEVFRKLSDPNCSPNQLFLLPRGHLKSHCIAVWCVWSITREPWTSIVYLSAGDDLATIQMYAIKQMLLSDEYRLLWPEMINKKESDRDKWATWAINVDHPERKLRGVRDYTIIIKTVKSTATGLHCDKLVFDDVVVPTNAYTAAGRSEVEMSIADYTSIKNTNAITKAVGTRYTDKDIYGQFTESTTPLINNDTGDIEGEEQLWDVIEYPVEDRGDGTGNYLWPKTKSPITGDWYGFDLAVLSRKKAEYASMGKLAQYYAQYYNNPNDSGTARLSDDYFMYYNRKHVERSGGSWSIYGKRLELFAAMDVAWSDDTGTSKRSGDWSAIAVVAIDEEGYFYILDLVKFKTTKFSIFYSEIMKLVEKWYFRRLIIETNSGGKFVKQEVDNLIRENNQSLVTIGVPRTKKDGTKTERYAAILEPKYESKHIYHYKGGLIPELEDQVKKARPKNDDLKDAVTAAIEHAKKPGRKRFHRGDVKLSVANERFGGRR